MGDKESRGILTSTDKDFVRGAKQYESRQSRYKRRSGIRERVCNAISDFPIIWTEMSLDEREKVYGKLDLPTSDLGRAVADPDLGPLEAMCAVVYEAALHREIPPEYIFHNAIKKVESERLLSKNSSRRVNVDLDLDISVDDPAGPNIDEALDRIEHGAAISDLEPRELSALISYSVQSDSLDSKTLAEAARSTRKQESETLADAARAEREREPDETSDDDSDDT